MEEKRDKQEYEYPSVGTVDFQREYSLSADCGKRTVAFIEDEVDPYTRAVDECSYYRRRRGS